MIELLHASCSPTPELHPHAHLHGTSWSYALASPAHVSEEGL
jgi:hypothetical protein